MQIGVLGPAAYARPSVAAPRRAPETPLDTVELSAPQRQRPNFWRNNALAIGFMALVGVGIGMHHVGVSLHAAHPIHANAATVTVERELASGQRCVADITNPVKDAPIEARLSQVNARLQPYGQKHYEIRLNDQHMKNAFACANGTLVVERDLAKALNDNELLFVGAHEQGHVELRHQATKLSYLDQTPWYAHIPIVGGPWATEFSSLSRDLEKAADCHAVRVLRAEGLPLEVADSALTKTVGNVPQGDTHPQLAERLAALRQCS